MESSDIERRIEELERRIRDLEARPVFVPMYAPYAPPMYPQPFHPHWTAPYSVWPFSGDAIGPFNG